MSERRRAAVIGIGMIGASLAAALRDIGWHVTGHDDDGERLAEALNRKILDAVGIDPQAEITFVATPVSSIPGVAIEALSRGGIVTDVGSVKGAVVAEVNHRRFVPGHPMAGSERSGLDAVNPQLFRGATWVLTPTPQTDPADYLEVRNVVTALGADVVTLDADEHDHMVATVSHVPHMAASAIMSVAVDHSDSHDALLRLAAGGFRDMTRIAAGLPSLWADIAFENRDAILDGLGRLTATLDEISEYVAAGDRENLEKLLSIAADARRDLPLRQGRPSELVSLSIVIPDRPGALAQVFGAFASARVNVEDLDINHAIQGGQGTLMVTVAASGSERAVVELEQAGFRVGSESL